MPHIIGRHENADFKGCFSCFCSISHSFLFNFLLSYNKLITISEVEGNMVNRRTCAFCGSNQLFEVVDFGDVAIAGAFLKEEDIPKEKKYPLAIDFCEVCFAVQVRDHIDPEILFEHDFYFSSAIKTLRDHFEEYAKEVTERFLPNPTEAAVLEFGSNDGVLLRPLASFGIKKVIGIDPAKNIVESVNNEDLVLLNDFFTPESAKRIVKEHGKVDIVMGNNVFAHISDINGITQAVTEVMKDDGVFVFEVHYLGKILEELQYDFMYHEHIYYYSLLALENHLKRHNMVIFDIKPISIHGGSIRYYAAKKESLLAQAISPQVIELRDRERELGYDKREAYQTFASQIETKKRELMAVLVRLKGEGKKIVGYGASGRANTILQYCGITKEHLEYMIDDAPAKQGLYTPGSHLLIRNSSVLKSDKPEDVLLFAWAFADEIISKNSEYLEDGGEFIIPLPEVRIKSAKN